MIKDNVEYHRAIEEMADAEKERANPSDDFKKAMRSPVIRKDHEEMYAFRKREIAEYVASGGDTNLMHVPLQEWFSAKLDQDKDLIYLPAMKDQVMFVRDCLARIASAGLSYERSKEVAFVVSEHRSKSVALPVYSLERPDIGLRFVLRDNFHDWKLSVISEMPVEADFTGLFHTTPPVEPDYTGNPLAWVYFEGFPRDLVFGYYAEGDKRRWSAAIGSREGLWTAMFLIMRSQGHIRPARWHTRESHEAELAAERNAANPPGGAP